VVVVVVCPEEGPDDADTAAIFVGTRWFCCEKGLVEDPGFCASCNILIRSLRVNLCDNGDLGAL